MSSITNTNPMSSIANTSNPINSVPMSSIANTNPMSSTSNIRNYMLRVATCVNELKRFSSFLIKVVEVRRVREHILLNALRCTRQEGRHAAAFGCKKKKNFVEKALRILFENDGPLNE